MPFRVTARTLLHLGAELISSDAVAFYELIKNAFDAGSPRVTIAVCIRIPFDTQLELQQHIQDALASKPTTPRDEPDHDAMTAPTEDQGNGSTDDCDGLEELREHALTNIMPVCPGRSALENDIRAATDITALLNVIQEANYITITDTGHGMSLRELEDVFLTIGTRSRLQERQRQTASATARPAKPILGEKGVGRLSAMRLGQRLLVTTSRKGETRWNLLAIDWNIFSHESDALIEEIDVSPETGPSKDDSSASGTTIRISALTSDWSRDKVADIAGEQFAKLTDPFTPSTRYPITLRFNGDLIPIPRFERELLAHAHAVVTARYRLTSDSGPILSGHVKYEMRGREKTFRVEGAHLTSVTGFIPAVLENLGPFTLEFYWFNRQAMTAIPSIGDLSYVRELQSRWAGGIMVFRDGFRVHPYGDPSDDWLELDRRALASSGYKVNRRQIIGKLDVTSKDNPRLVDQTNREGLRDCPERRALVALLKHVMQSEFRPFLDLVDTELNARLPASLHEIDARIAREEQRVTSNLDQLLRLHPAAAENSEIITGIKDALRVIRESIAQANDLAASFERGRTQLVHLASLGLMVEFLAHELHRATAHTLGTLGRVSSTGLPQDMASLISTLDAQLRTLQKRLRVLDPLSTPGRQVKESFDVVTWVREIAQSHEDQFRRHRITCAVTTEPANTKDAWTIHSVKGMLVQIIENLLSNSVYWLKQQAVLQAGFRPSIGITIDPARRQIRLADNGPGIPPERREEVFQAFVTTKPPGEGRGLGLYIAREVAKYMGGTLQLTDECTQHENRLNTFVLELESAAK